MSRCCDCGMPVRFIRSQKDGKKIAVDNAMVCFLPPDGHETTEWFINAAGIDVKGRRATDGMTGYKRHKCGV